MRISKFQDKKRRFAVEEQCVHESVPSMPSSFADFAVNILVGGGGSMLSDVPVNGCGAVEVLRALQRDDMEHPIVV